MRRAPRRPEQVGETIREVVADLLARGELRDPRVGLVTVTRVEVSGDLSHARVYVSPAGDQPDRALEGLRHAAGFLRSRVARALSTRTVPELHLELDRGIEHAARINAVLEAIRHEARD